MPGDSVSMSYRLFGEDVSATKALKGVADQADRTGKKVGDGMEEGASHLERLGDHADTSEQRIMGLKDSVDGLTTVMQGPGEQGLAAYLQGWADLSSGIANFVVPALMKVIPATVKNAASTVASTVAQTAASAASTASATARSGTEVSVAGPTGFGETPGLGPLVGRGVVKIIDASSRNDCGPESTLRWQ